MKGGWSRRSAESERAVSSLIEEPARHPVSAHLPTGSPVFWTVGRSGRNFTGYFHRQFIRHPFPCDNRQKPSGETRLPESVSGISIAVVAQQWASRYSAVLLVSVLMYHDTGHSIATTRTFAKANCAVQRS